MSAIHQILAGYSHGDAISNEARVLRDIFRSWGYSSEIFCELKRILPELRRDALDVETLGEHCQQDDVALLHLSIGSVVNDIFPDISCRKALLYHNITPPEYLRGIQPQMAHDLAKGREQAARLAQTADVVMADSKFNAEELAQWGYKPAGVLPLVLDLSCLRARPDRATMKQYGDGLKNILFVGRCVPNKRLEDLLYVFHYYQRYVEPNSRLLHIGSFAGTEKYNALLLTRARELELRNVEMPGAVRQNQLIAAYRSAHAFICMSEHEGFCIPLIESMVHDVPVLAYSAGAVPETLDGAGILVKEKQFDLIAEMTGKVISDSQFRSDIITGQRQRLKRYEDLNLEQVLRNQLQPILSS